MSQNNNDIYYNASTDSGSSGSPILLLNKSSNPKGKRLSPSPKRINIENKLKKNISAGKMLSKSSSSQDKKKSKIK